MSPLTIFGQLADFWVSGVPHTSESATQVGSRPGLGGARTHLLKAGSSLTAGEYADSVRESIHAVESVARVAYRRG